MNILLTGAGFTKNFGGFLADEMWTIIFNHPAIKRQASVRKFMLDNNDYELIYHTIINDRLGGMFDDHDKTAIRTAVSNAYKQLDYKILAWNSGTSSIEIFNVAKLINCFAEDRSSMSYFFTLNQDLLIERHFIRFISHKTLNLPGDIHIKPASGSDIDRRSPLKTDDFITLPNQDKVNKIRSTPLSTHDFHYIKLHGSYNWKSSSGNEMMVIGQGKEEQIMKEPLLEWYYEIFNKALTQGRARLFVIGYGFRDKHINKIIAESIKRHNLQLYVFSPIKPYNFFESLLSSDGEANTIYEGICGYYPYDFSQVFPSFGSETEEYKVIYNNFLS